jgi:magnesium transporter
MPTKDEQSPWIELEKLVEESDPERMIAFLEALPLGEPARAILHLHAQDQVRLLTTLDPKPAADLVEQIPDAHAAELLEQLEPQTAAAIVDKLPSDEQADLIGDLPRQEADAILDAMDPNEARDARLLSGYPDDVAGGLMVTEFLAYPETFTVADVVDDLRTNADEYRTYNVQYAYVTSQSARLVGVLQLRDLLLARKAQAINELMRRAPLTVTDLTNLNELRDFFDRHPFYGVPVTDQRHLLVGVVRRAAVEEALAERSDSDYRKSQGIVGGEELRTMPLMLRSRRRLAWLSVNILLNVLAASVIAFYQDTLAAVIALAVFLPIISDMSGCSGNQAAAVSMRELALGIVRPPEVLYVLGKEILLGMINGAALGILIASVAWLWKGNPYLGLVVGGALALNTIVAVCIGGTIPLLLKRMGKDPALASGPILTTVTDMCGFFIVLSFASALLPQLLGPS